LDHTVEERGPVKVLSLSGPIDVSRSMELRDLLGELIDGPAARIVLDLSEVTLIDSSGIGVLVTAHRRADSAGARFALAGASANVGRVFELTRTNKLLSIHPSVEEGIGALSAD
jgi:anti-sigma B factor antagonist